MVSETIFQLIVLIFSVVIHEVSHGVVAERLGDPTARLAGRLTLNPLKHLDPIGSVVLPLLMLVLNSGVVFGWAKPVPYNPMNLKRPERDGAIVAAVGPLSNLFIAFLFGMVYRFIIPSLGGSATLAVFGGYLEIIVTINVLLAVFNLVPIPPLDGSKVLFALLPSEMRGVRFLLEQYGMFLVLIFIFFGFHLITPIIWSLTKLFLGV
ncbi:site-2 protease family protein [Candidatus Jorgensenbacteria bacterium]|nr:site-2 protease family protein [Candidatus Jorgensenbacteria bacterium]